MGQVEEVLRRRNARALSVSLLMVVSTFAVAFMIVSAVSGSPFSNAKGKATCERYNTGDIFTIRFVAQDSSDTPGDDNGMFRYEDVNGYYRLRVDYVRVLSPEHAVFTGYVTDTTHPQIGIDEWIVIWVWDKDEANPDESDCYADHEADVQEYAYLVVDNGAVPPQVNVDMVVSGDINVISL